MRADDVLGDFLPAIDDHDAVESVVTDDIARYLVAAPIQKNAVAGVVTDDLTRDQDTGDRVVAGFHLDAVVAIAVIGIIRCFRSGSDPVGLNLLITGEQCDAVAFVGRDHVGLAGFLGKAGTQPDAIVATGTGGNLHAIAEISGQIHADATTDAALADAIADDQVVGTARGDEDAVAAIAAIPVVLDQVVAAAGHDDARPAIPHRFRCAH